MQRTAAQLAQDIVQKKASSRELVCDSLKRISELNPALGAVVRQRADKARAEAEKLDLELRQGKLRGPLHGVPIAIKDNLALEDEEVTGCSRILSGFRPPFTATAVRRLIDAGAVIVAQCSMDEFAMGSSNERSCYGPVRNPVDTERVPGGSSGGCAAAVASGMVPLAIGSDTGGSIRQPASFCGLVGLKPSYGRVSRYGLFAYASSLDQIGPLSNSVADASLALSVMEGHDPNDATSKIGLKPLVCGDTDPGKLRIGVLEEFLDPSKGLRPEIATLIESRLNQLRQAGCQIETVHLPILDHVIPTYYLIANCEASSNLARYDSIRYGLRAEKAANLNESYCKTRSLGFGEEVKNRIMVGTYALSAGYYDAYYRKADALRQQMRADLSVLFSKVDILLGPTTPDVAFKLGEKISDPLSMYAQDLYTTFVNLAYVPAISIPCGEVDRLPVGLQLVADRFADARLLDAATTLEKIFQT